MTEPERAALESLSLERETDVRLARTREESVRMSRRLNLLRNILQPPQPAPPAVLTASAVPAPVTA